MMPFPGLHGWGGPSGECLEFGRCGNRFSRQSPVQARFAGLVVGHDNGNILLGGLDSISGGYCPADILLAYLGPCMARTRTFRAGQEDAAASP